VVETFVRSVFEALPRFALTGLVEEFGESRPAEQIRVCADAILREVDAAADAGRSTTRRDLSLLLARGLRTKTTVALSRAEGRELAELLPTTGSGFEPRAIAGGPARGPRDSKP
jgi:hypothetical protein